MEKYFITRTYTRTYNKKTEELSGLIMKLDGSLICIDVKVITEYISTAVNALNQQYPRCKTLNVRTIELIDNVHINIGDGSGNAVAGLKLELVKNTIECEDDL